MSIHQYPEDYTENENRHYFQSRNPNEKTSDFDAENDFNGADHQTANPANKQPYAFRGDDTEEKTGPGDALLHDRDDSLTQDEPHDADPQQTKPGQRRTGSADGD